MRSLISLSLSLSLSRSLSLSLSLALSLSHAITVGTCRTNENQCHAVVGSSGLLQVRDTGGVRRWQSTCVCARACVSARASESERERGNERARGSEREESERASSTRRAAALRSRDVLWKSFILCACGPATPPHNLRGCPHGWAAGLLPDRSTSFRALAQPARRWWPQRSGVTQIHSGITQRANSAVQSIRGNAKCQNVTQCNAKPSQHQRGAFTNYSNIEGQDVLVRDRRINIIADQRRRLCPG